MKTVLACIFAILTYFVILLVYTLLVSNNQIDVHKTTMSEIPLNSGTVLASVPCGEKK